MRVGLGSGTTAQFFILALAARGLEVTCVATSDASTALAREHGLTVVPLGREGVHLAADGADAVDHDLRLIKGAGGAHVREKIVAAAAQRFVVIVDDTKLLDPLPGRVPVELLEFGAERTLSLLEATGGRYVLREQRSDSGNLLADGHYESMADPEGLAARLDAIPGVVGHGLFLGMADLLIVGRNDGSVEERRPSR